MVKIIILVDSKSIINFQVVLERIQEIIINLFSNPQRTKGSGSGMYCINSTIIQHFMCMANEYFHEYFQLVSQIDIR